MADVEFFWDPVCPWAWITSRWVHEVATRRPLDVDWRFISLRLVNDAKYADGTLPERSKVAHGMGLRLLRVAAAAREAHGAEHVADLYTAFGTRIHVDGRREELLDGTGVPAVLEEVGLPAELAGAADDERWDEPVRTDTETALERAGKELGTPILTFGPPDGPSFFGPVINRIPRGDDAVALWDCVSTAARFPGFSELKRSVRGKPETS
jgi:2-hydroxychromene-2-carboxylate isomerase